MENPKSFSGAKSNTRQEVSFKERQPRKGTLQTSAAKHGSVQTAVANESPVEANSTKKVETEGSKPATTGGRDRGWQ